MERNYKTMKMPLFHNSNHYRKLFWKWLFASVSTFSLTWLWILTKPKQKKIQLVKLFPDQCTIKTDPFMAFKDLRVLSNLSIVDTWINSSVMVKLFKNVWKSSFEETVFLNITYDEDTPDGFQLPKQNHTTNLRAFVLDGVHHHQYHYPTFKASMELVNKLTYLRFSGTGMNILPYNLISAIRSLKVLDLSNNLLDEIGFWWIGCSSHKVFPALRKLSRSHNRFKDLAEIAKNVNDMKFIRVSWLEFQLCFHWQTMFLATPPDWVESLPQQSRKRCVSLPISILPKDRPFEDRHKCYSFKYYIIVSQANGPLSEF